MTCIYECKLFVSVKRLLMSNRVLLFSYMIFVLQNSIERMTEKHDKLILEVKDKLQYLAYVILPLK
jgi:hypothetical protein